MNFRTTQDLKKLVLSHCGELQDGTSHYETQVMQFLNSAYQGVIAGGNEFGMDVSEPWSWAKARKPIVINLEIAYESGTVALTESSVNGSFSIAPTTSMEGRFLKVLDFDDYYIIRKHVAGETAFQLDQVWMETSGSYNFTAIPLEYDVIDDNIVIDNYSNKFEFSNNSSSFIATVANGVYEPSAFCVALQAAMTAAGGVSVTCAYNTLTRKFVIGHGGPSFSIVIASASIPEASGWSVIGFDTEDKTGSLSYKSDNPLNAIQRLVAPITIYRNITPRFLAPEDSGKIMGVDALTLQRKYPLTQMYPYVPDVFAVTQWHEDGSIRIRFNTYPRFKMRVEIDYIPIPQDLKDNALSTPLIPRAYREYLVYAAAYYIMLLKSDNRADTYAALAKSKLVAMVNDNRANKELSSNKFGRLLPRAITSRPWRVIP